MTSSSGRTLSESPPQALGPVCARLTSDVDKALQLMTEWGVRVPENSRLQQARTYLARVATDGEVQVSASVDCSRAVWVCLDFVDIANSLPVRPEKALRRELQLALTGSLWPLAGQRQPLQLQTQHWIGAALRRVGARYTSPAFRARRATKAADMLLEDGLLPIPLEIKRPEVSHRIPSLLAAARDQVVASGGRGGIILDVSDCLNQDVPGEIEEDAWRLTQEARAVVWRPDGYGFQPGFQPVTYLAVLARGLRIQAVEVPTLLGALVYSAAATFADPPNTLYHLKAQRLQAHVHRAFDGVVDRLASFGIPASGA